jgi:hypothetical protein
MTPKGFKHKEDEIRFSVIYVLLMVLVFGCSTLGVSAPQRKESPAILSPFPYPCNGPYKDKNLSEEGILKVRRAHEKWLKDLKDPEGHKANFCGAKLSHGKFQEADLKSAVFQMAMLAGANFTGAMLNKAQLQGANLSGANFSQADLTEAKLDHAMLHLATFRKTNLHRASLRHAMLYKANLQGIDLTDVEGLTQSQINMACLDGDTKLHKDLNRPEPCSQKTRH